MSIIVSGGNQADHVICQVTFKGLPPLCDARLVPGQQDAIKQRPQWNQQHFSRWTQVDVIQDGALPVKTPERQALVLVLQACYKGMNLFCVCNLCVETSSLCHCQTLMLITQQIKHSNCKLILQPNSALVLVT